jgi:ferrous iron transport protein A
MLKLYVTPNSNAPGIAVRGVFGVFYHQERGTSMPLTLSRKGERSSIKHIGGPGDLKKRLETLGFTVGSEVTVVSELAGNLIVNVKDSRVAISREMANKILV